MSKRSEGKDDDRPDILDVVQKFCTSPQFETEFEEFAKDNADVFRDAGSFSVHSKEHPLEFHQVYRQYLSKFEGMIEDFIEKNGYEVKDFYAECKAILEDEGTFGRKKFFIETMLAISEYENFFLLMQSEMRLQQASSNSPAKK